MSRALVDSVASQIESVVGAARTVYRGEVPDNPAARYVVVRSNIGTDESVDLADSQTLRSATVWVTSASRNDNPVTAHDEALWGAEKAHDALKGWRPNAGSWKPVPLSSQLPQRDEALPSTVVFTVETWGFQFQP